MSSVEGKQRYYRCFSFQYLGHSSPTAPSFKKKGKCGKGNSICKNRHIIISFSPAMGQKSAMFRVIHLGEFIDCNFYKTVITLKAD